MLKVLDLFSGIGGFSLGLERTGGFETVAFCEIEDYPRKVLAKHWPDVPIYEDVRNVTKDQLIADGIDVDIITGGFPCQDLSTAGRQNGLKDGTRSGLWSEIARLVGELRPKFVIVENVANLLVGPSEQRGRWFGRVLGDLAERGYDAEWENIPASAVGAPHRRERVWLVAYPQQDGCSMFGRPLASAPGELSPWVKQIQSRTKTGDFRSHWGEQSEWLTKSPAFTVDDGFPELVAEYAAAGNSVVPQIPEMIGYAILEAEGTK
tara:strand:- start:375 stop:1166 length:792 start_codon:yes stop_codon:yes gene_type:complete